MISEDWDTGRLPMVMACMIWKAMALSGVFCGVVLGSTHPFVWLTASTSIHRLPTTNTGFVVCQDLGSQVHSSLSVLCEVGVELSKKLMKELSDPSPRLGPTKKTTLIPIRLDETDNLASYIIIQVTC